MSQSVSRHPEPAPVDHTPTSVLTEHMDAASSESESESEVKIRCDACPIRCFILPGRTGSCDRYGNVDGILTRMDPVTVLQRATEQGKDIVPFGLVSDSWSGEIVRQGDVFVTGTGSGTTYPDYKPAPFIVSQEIDGVDMVTVVTEGIFSYCGAKVKIDTDRSRTCLGIFGR